MSKYLHKQRHRLKPSPWLYLMKVVIAIGQIISVVKEFWDSFGD